MGLVVEFVICEVIKQLYPCVSRVRVFAGQILLRMFQRNRSYDNYLEEAIRRAMRLRRCRYGLGPVPHHHVQEV